MEKRFRHRLVMILIYGDLMRGTWLFVFAIISLARGSVRTGSTFCQVSGFLVQYGTQTSDYAVFVMALHSAIQVFYPSTLVSSDGLYPCRRYVYFGAFALPILMAGLAFINPKNPYVSQGAFCTLPIRPFWYRLAFTWVPRYIIALTIMGLAIAIYTHVGIEFRAYSNADTSFQSLKTSNGSNTTHNDTSDEMKLEDITFELTNMESRPQPTRRKSSVGHDVFTSQRHNSSAPALSPPFTAPQRVFFESGLASHPLPGSTLNLPYRSNTTRPALLAIPSGQSITAPLSPHALPSHPDPITTHAPEPTATPASSSTRTPSPSSPAQLRLAKQRQRIHRQLRLMFIYPLVYTLMWLIPFTMHCMNYWDKWALNPVEFLRVGSSICITLMGFADALIFSLREKPWRGIEGGDGSFWGSFRLWRRAGKDEESAQVGSEGRGRGSQIDWTSASGDFARIAAEQARQRLDLERQERMNRLDGRPVDDEADNGKQWEHGGLNVGDGKKGQVYDDNGLEDDTAETEYNSHKWRELEPSD
ncbi:hypothetical protein E8E11_000123 [Didymella keratinophila]|nr:hypothetical protein E8E11_000123 [Didymella keratinophila]